MDGTTSYKDDLLLKQYVKFIRPSMIIEKINEVTSFQFFNDYKNRIDESLRTGTYDEDTYRLVSWIHAKVDNAQTIIEITNMAPIDILGVLHDIIGTHFSITASIATIAISESFNNELYYICYKHHMQLFVYTMDLMRVFVKLHMSKRRIEYAVYDTRTEFINYNSGLDGINGRYPLGHHALKMMGMFFEALERELLIGKAQLAEKPVKNYTSSRVVGKIRYDFQNVFEFEQYAYRELELES